MNFSINYPLVLFLIPLFIANIARVSSQFSFFDFYCSEYTGNYTTPSTYKRNLDIVLLDLTNRASSSLFDNQTIGEGIDQAYGIYLCRGDLNFQQCHDCVSEASSEIFKHCPVEKKAIIWYDQCMVRYANSSIFSREDSTYRTASFSTANVSNPTQFGQIISSTVDFVINQAAYNTSARGYATAEHMLSAFDNVYVMGICTPDILGSRCERCLRVAFRSMGACCGTARMRMSMYLPSCWLRYALAPFVGELDVPAPSPSESTHSFDLPVPQLFPPPPPPPPAEHSKGTTIMVGGFDFTNRLVMISIMLLIIMVL